MRLEVATEIALRKRQELQARARDIGISEPYIDRLVETFYARVRLHPHLGPIFNESIGDEWPEHLAKLKRFWTSIALRTGTYRGNPIEVHQAVSAALPEHFPLWLELFEQTLADTAPNEEVCQFFMAHAHRMAARLSSAMFCG
jgi:hemoglobin